MGILQKKIRLSTLLKLQIFYCVLGIGYNVVSYYLIMSGGRALSSNSPVVGAISMVTYGLCLLSGQKGFYKTYRLLMAIGSNAFGLVLNFVAVAGRFEIDNNAP